MILRVAEGMPITDIAATVGLSQRFVSTWVQRFREHGVEGLTDQARPSSQCVPRQRALAEAPRLSACRTCTEVREPGSG
jgi:transposase